MDHRHNETIARLFGGPAWRRTIAERAAREGRPSGEEYHDELIRRATAHFRICDEDANGPQRAAKLFPNIALAAQLWNSPPDWLTVQECVLAEFSVAEIAAKLKIGEAVVKMAELLAFDVRCELRSPAWIMTSVIQPVVQAGEHDRAISLQLAFFGGRTALKSFLKSRSGMPVAAIEQLAQAILLLAAKAKAVAAMPLAGAQAIDFARVASDFRLEEQRVAVRRMEVQHILLRWAERQARRHDIRSPGRPAEDVVNAEKEGVTARGGRDAGATQARRRPHTRGRASRGKPK